MAKGVHGTKAWGSPMDPSGYGVQKKHAITRADVAYQRRAEKKLPERDD